MYYLNNKNSFEPQKTRVLYEFPNYKEPNKKPYASRYNNTRIIIDKHNSTEYHESVPCYTVANDKSDTYITADNELCRLDIISHKIYGTSMYWWAIAMANNIDDAFVKIPKGTVLRIPKMTSLYKHNSVLSSGGFYK